MTKLFIYASPKSVERLSKGRNLLWLPVALFRVANCSGEQYLVDCFIAPTLQSSLTRILLVRKVDVAIELTSTSPIKAPMIDHIKCCEEDVRDDFVNAFKEFEERYAGVRELMKEKRKPLWSPWKAFLALIIPPALLIERNELAKRIKIVEYLTAKSALTDIRRKLCVDINMQFEFFKPCYVLTHIDVENQRVHFIMGKNAIRSKVHELKIFGNENILQELLKHLERV